MRPTHIAGALLVLLTADLSAQTTVHELRPGSRLRITAGDTSAPRFIGILDWVSRDSVIMHDKLRRTPGPRRKPFALADLRSIEVSRRQPGSGFANGAVVGGLVGAILLSSQRSDNANVLTALLSASVGGLLGEVFTPDRWRTVPLRSSAAGRRALEGAG